MTQVMTIRVKDRKGLKRFEDWCERNGVTATVRGHSPFEQIEYYFDSEGMMGIYDVAKEDVMLVKLRWSGELA